MADREGDDSPRAGSKSRDENQTHRGWKSKWVESAPPSAVHPVDDKELKGHNILGDDSPRDGGEKAI